VTPELRSQFYSSAAVVGGVLGVFYLRRKGRMFFFEKKNQKTFVP
jgi:hypothetical protein